MKFLQFAALAAVWLIACSFVAADDAADKRKKFVEDNRSAIEKGCKYLESTQKTDGSFPPAWEMADYDAGTQAFCLLALLHGGRERDAAHMRKGLAALDRMLSRNLIESYTAGIVLMMYQKLYEEQQWEAELFTAKPGKEFDAARKRAWKAVAGAHKKIIGEMVDYLNSTALTGERGGWGYRAVTAKQAKQDTQHSDNSSSQFAMLGYKAASMLGAKVDPEVFFREARRLTRQYKPEKGGHDVEYTFDPLGNIDVATAKAGTDNTFEGSISSGGWTYACNSEQETINLPMTAAGLGSLAICLDELKARELITRDKEIELAQKVGLAMRGALVYTAREYPFETQIANLRHSGAGTMGTIADGAGIYYNLYTVERACIFADVVTLPGERDWYAEGARGLVKSQAEDGSWPFHGTPMGLGGADKTRVIDTSMAILFLRQAAPPVVTEHVRRDRERAERIGDKEPDSAPTTQGPDETIEPPKK